MIAYTSVNSPYLAKRNNIYIKMRRFSPACLKNFEEILFAWGMEHGVERKQYHSVDGVRFPPSITIDEV